jgi:hypothetical protein
MWELFEEYILHEKNNPMYKIDYVGKEGRKEHTELETPITFEGFECYLEDKGIISHLSDYSANKDNKYSEYSTIITRIKRNCFVHNFKGASVGLFNANLIAKKLGIKEQTDITTNGENISMNNNIIIEIVEPEED